MKTKVEWCGMLIATLALAGPAKAEMMAYQFAGVVEWVTDPGNALRGLVQSGTSFSGLFRFDSDAQDLAPDSVWGDYRGPSFSITVNFGPYSGDSAASVYGSAMILVANDSSGGDGLGLSAEDFPVTDELEIASVSAGLADYTGNIFANDSLPLGPFDLSGLDTSFTLKGDISLGVGMFVVGGGLTSFTVTPEPTAVLLTLLGLGLLHRRSGSHTT
jgi:hypothetical protein